MSKKYAYLHESSGLTLKVNATILRIPVLFSFLTNWYNIELSYPPCKLRYISVSGLVDVLSHGPLKMAYFEEDFAKE